MIQNLIRIKYCPGEWDVKLSILIWSLFGVFNSPQKWIKTIWLEVKFLVRFLGEFQKDISKLTDLYSTFKWCAYRSKYSAHHSQSSVLLIPLSYLIPTVKIIKRLIWSESIFDPVQISLFTISTLNFFSLNLTEFFKRNSVKYFYFMLVILFLVTNLVPYTRALHASKGVWWEKMWKRCCKGRERPPTKSKFTYMTSLRIFFLLT